MASRERTGSGMKGRGTEWDEVGKKDMYTTREKIREKKKVAPQGEVWFPGRNFAERRALRAAIHAGSRRSMYVYMYKKENKMYMFTYTKKRTKCICLHMQNLKRYA